MEIGKGIGELFVALVGVIVILIGATLLGYYKYSTAYTIKELHELGHVEYYLDENDERQWRWLCGEEESDDDV